MRDARYGCRRATVTDDEAVRQAYIAIREAAEHYRAVRDLQPTFYGGAWDDALERFFEMRNVQAVWPGFAYRGTGTGPAPWAGMTAAQRLQWVVNDAGAELWCPTLDQAEDAYRALVAARRPRKVVVGVYVGPP